MEDDLVLVRVAGLPGAFAADCLFRETRYWAERYEADQAALDTARTALEDELHRLVPLAVDASTRAALLRLRRAVHNDRWGSGELSAAIETLPPIAVRQLSTWRALLDGRNRAAVLGAEALQHDQTALQTRLKAAWSQPHVRRGILISQRQLYRDLDHEGVCRRPCSQTTKVDHHRRRKSLHAYLWRMATKSSPMSTLTVVAIGELADADHFGGFDVSDTACVSVVAPATVDAVARAVDRATAPAGRGWLRLAQPLSQTDGELRFLVPAEHNSSEVVRSVTASALLLVIVALIEEAAGPTRRYALVGKLADVMNLPAPVAEEVVTKAILLGLVRTSMGHCSADSSALTEVATAARSAGQPGLARRIAAITTAVNRLGDLDDASCADALDEIDSRLGTVTDPAPGRRPVFERQLVRHPVRVPRAPVSTVRRDLRALTGVLQFMSLAAGPAEFVQETLHGADPRGVDLLAAFRRVRAAIAETCENPIASLAEAGAHTAAAQSLTIGRGEMTRELLELARAGTTVHLDDSWADRWTQRARQMVPETVRTSVGYLGQLAELTQERDVVFVLNRTMPGHGTLMAAWCAHPTDASARLAEALRARIAGLAPDGEAVELRAGLGFGGQVQPQVTTRCLTYPAIREGGVDDRAVPWRDVTVKFDPSRGRWVLWDRCRRRRLLPVHVGSIAPLYFPPFYEFLASFGPTPVHDLALVDQMHSGCERSGDGPREIHYHPRIRHKHVLLSRATWCVSSEQVPVEPGAHLSFTDFLRWRGWARTAGLPDRVFVSTATASEAMRERSNSRVGSRNRRRLSHKPVYVDFNDAGSCQLLHRYAQGMGSTLRVTEALPDPTGPSPRTAVDGRVTELLLEMDVRP